MDIASRKFRFSMTPVTILGATAIALLLTITIIRYNTAAESQGGVSKSTIETSVESAQTTETPGQPAADESAKSQEGASSSITSTTTLDSSTSSVQGSVTVNGQTYAVPPSGEFHQTIVNEDGQTSVNISSHSSGSGQSYNSSSSNVQVFSQSDNIHESSERGSQ